jgi:hypothetical protein
MLMSRVRNVSGGPLDVPLLDRVVEDGETVEVPDVQADGESPIVWPSNRWEPVTGKVAPEKAAKTSAASGKPAG